MRSNLLYIYTGDGSVFTSRNFAQVVNFVYSLFEGTVNLFTNKQTSCFLLLLIVYFVNLQKNNI